MSNNTTITIINGNKWDMSVIIIAYYAFSLIIVGTVLNLLTFFTLCRQKFRDTNERPILHYMRTIAIFDILMLFGWNFDHYTLTIYGFELTTYTIISCKYASFLNYFTSQTSAWLRVFVSFDRFLSLKYRYRTWFGKSKTVLIIIASIIGFFILFNLHIIIFACFYEPNGLLNTNSYLYTIYPTWDFVNLALYNCLPFLSMVIFNSYVIYHLIYLRHTTTIRNSRIPHQGISIALIITTFLFVIMTTPATVAFGFFVNTAGDIILYTLDSILYTYHILSFPTYMITWDDFRQEFIKMMTCNYFNRRVVPPIHTPMQETNKVEIRKGII